MKILIQDPEDRNLSIKLSRTLSIKQRAASSTNHPSLQTSPYVHELGLRLAVNRVQRDHRFCSRPRPICLYLKILSILRQIPSPERQMHSRLMSVPVSLWYTPPLIFGCVVGGWRRANGLFHVLNLFLHSLGCFYWYFDAVRSRVLCFLEPIFNFFAFLFLIKFCWMPGEGDGKLIIKRPKPKRNSSCYSKL